MVDQLKPADSGKYVLVIDLGSTSLKASVVENTGRILSIITEPVETIILPDGGAEQDAEDWWQKAMRAAKKAIFSSRIPADNIMAVCCDSQFSVIVPVDKDSKPLMNAIHWFDSRGGKYTQPIMKGFPSIQGLGLRKILKWIRHTGIVPIESGVDSLAHILYIKNAHPEIYQKTHKFFEPVDYLTSRLTGQFTASQHTVAIFMVTSNRHWGVKDYCDPLIKATGLDREKLPDLISNDGIIGPIKPSISKELGLSPSTLVTAGMLDNQAALIGSGVTGYHQGMVYVGTSLNINGHVPQKKTDILNSIASIPGCLPGKYMLICEQGLGGKCLDFFLKNIVWHNDALAENKLPEDCYQRVNEIVKNIPPGSGKVMFLPWLNGAIAPSENKNARGGFFNLSLDSTRAHLTRAVMEGVSFNSKAALGPVERFLGKKMDFIRMAGGGALSDVWAQIYADVLNIPIHQLEEPHKVTCRGTGLVGFSRLGLIKTDEIPKLVQIKRIFEPIKENVALYNKMYDQYRQIFKKNSAVFKSLNER
ncbi:FGGY-family carbohydrate kinase [bacterium]|nr:FGGY-family carbohydrate kinase [bacterium]